MTTQLVINWAEIAVALVTIAGSIAASIKWLVKHYLNELKPNHGSSLKDAVNRLEQDQLVLFNKLDDMYKVLLDHVAKH